MSLTGETQSSRGPKGAASGESYEADAQRVNLRGRYKEAEEVSLAAETPLQVFSFAGEGRR